ncbi:MAG: cytochrome C [Thermodesulfobacteria bacterium]|nr:cytochrome C [Thermodesulfobacteriota bacterium]
MKKHFLPVFLLLAVCFAGLSLVQAQEEEKYYVGSRACADCHEEEYATYQKFAKKAHSFEAVVKMRDKLTTAEVQECYHCHTTGYGRPGGFKDEHTTPDLKNVGCEACHGPGSAHVESEDPEDIWGDHEKIRNVCEACHTKERVEAFNYRPLLHGGAH